MDALEPLRQRYVSQHHNLRKFYYECSNLKYLTGLINVPKLGQVSWRRCDEQIQTHTHVIN
jgi:huntingtin-interacting protein 1-related protein